MLYLCMYLQECSEHLHTHTSLEINFNKYTSDLRFHYIYTFLKNFQRKTNILKVFQELFLVFVRNGNITFAYFLWQTGLSCTVLILKTACLATGTSCLIISRISEYTL